MYESNKGLDAIISAIEKGTLMPGVKQIKSQAELLASLEAASRQFSETYVVESCGKIYLVGVGPLPPWVANPEAWKQAEIENTVVGHGAFDDSQPYGQRIFR